MTRTPNKPQLRNTLKKLAAIPTDQGGSHENATAAQEALDFLAMLAGLKPVLLLGRGFNDPGWIGGAAELARGLDLHVIDGPYWEPAVAMDDLPDWFVEHGRAAFAGRTAKYICRARAVADEVRAVCEVGSVDIAREARLLGYPECCVAAHHDGIADYQTIWLDVLRRAAGGGEAGMKRLLAAGTALDGATPEDIERLERAMAVSPCPFTSINMCAPCREHPESAARRLSRRYAALARDVDKGLAATLAKISSIGAAVT